MDVSDTATETEWDIPSVSEEPEATTEPAGSEEPSPDDADDASPAAADDDAGTQPEEPADDGADDAPDAAPQDGPASPDEEPPQDVKPFAFRADGREVAIPGAVETQGYIAIPVAEWQRRIQPHLVADRRALVQQERDRGRRDAEATLDTHPRVKQAELLLGEIEKLKAGGLPAVVDWAESFLTQLPVLEAKAEAAAARAKLEQATRERTETEQAEAAQQLAAEMRSTLQAHVDQALQGQLKGLGLDAAELVGELWELRSSLFVAADRDYPEWGIRQGEPAIRLDVLQKLLGRQAQVAQRARATAAEVTQARQKNTAALGAKTPHAPPAVPARGSPAPAGRRETQPSSYDEWIESLSKA